MCNPTTQNPISEAMPLVNALIEECERNCIDLSNVDIFAHTDGRFAIELIPYDGAAQALIDHFDLTSWSRYTSNGRTYDAATRWVGRWIISSRVPLDAGEVAA